VTTVAWNPKTGMIYTDSQTTSNNHITTDKVKMVLLGPGDYVEFIRGNKRCGRLRAMVGVGSVPMIEMLMGSILKHGRKADTVLNAAYPLQEMLSDHMQGAVLFFTDHQVWLLRASSHRQNTSRDTFCFTRVMEEDKVVAYGSGKAAVLVGDAMKLPTVEAMRLARIYDPGSGGSIRSYHRDPETGLITQMEQYEDHGNQVDFASVQKSVQAISPESFPGKTERLVPSKRLNAEVKAQSKLQKPRARYIDGVLTKVDSSK